MSIVRNFNLYLNAGNGSAPYINANQYDQGEQWVFTLYKEDGTKYTPSTGAIVGIKADNRGIINTGTVDADGRVVINETQQMTAAAGIAIFELLIDGDSHGTANFLVNVEQRPGDNADLSDSDLSLIQQAVDSAEVIVEVIGDGDPSEVIGEHVDAWLDNHPEATTTVQDGAITAPKINQSLWDKLLVNEEASGNPASFEDGADDVPVSSLKVALEPIQTGSGDPSPSNIRPIIASNGKNLLQVTGTTQTINGVTFTVNADGTVTANGTATAQSTFVVADFTGTNGTQYIVNGAPSASAFGTYFLSATLAADYGSGATFTGTGASNSVRIIVQSGQTVNNLVFKPMIRLASITDSTFQPYQGIMVDVKGKNLIWTSNNGTDHGVTCTRNSDGTYAVTGTATGTAVNVWLAGGYGTGYKLCKVPAGTVIATDCVIFFHYEGGTLQGFGSDGTLGGRRSTIYTFTEPAWIDGVRCPSAVNGTTYNTTIYPQLEYGTEATAYEPYTSASYPYTLGQNVYGGTVDLATGVLTVDKWIVDMGTATYGNANALGWSQITSVGAKQFDNSVVADVYCDILVADTANRVYQRSKDNSIGINSAGRIQFVMSSIANYTSAQIQTALTGHYVVYPLATPTTVQLTPQEVKTLLGYNNISSSGTVDVIYHADTKLYVDKMTNVDNAIIAPTEATFTATRNYTVNDLVIVNDTLYKVTSNIQNGGTITPNSNVTATTLATLIKALS